MPSPSHEGDTQSCTEYLPLSVRLFLCAGDTGEEEADRLGAGAGWRRVCKSQRREAMAASYSPNRMVTIATATPVWFGG